jgi:trk system potassium uptake protein TrkH
MLLGACAGSTSGGLKMIRAVILSKAMRVAVGRMIHPRMVRSVQMEDRVVTDDMLNGVITFFVAYITVLAVGVLLVSLDNFDFITTFSSALTCVSNVGPGLALVGPMGNFSIFSPLSKVVLTVLMIIGRLEVFPMLVLFSRGLWRDS